MSKTLTVMGVTVPMEHIDLVTKVINEKGRTPEGFEHADCVKGLTDVLWDESQNKRRYPAYYPYRLVDRVVQAARKAGLVVLRERRWFVAEGK